MKIIRNIHVEHQHPQNEESKMECSLEVSQTIACAHWKAIISVESPLVTRLHNAIHGIKREKAHAKFMYNMNCF